jgi:ATP-dependent Lon protease
MIDEMDKIGTDWRGDPASALLEALDPEQNFSFTDHYLAVPFDLSKVMFITTANLLDPIPPALKDRMEVLELPGYTREEKLMIAKQFQVPRQIKEHGLTSDQLKFQDKTIMSIIENYTREAGVRNLEREIAGICRGLAKRIVAGEIKTKIVIRPNMVSEFLGPLKFFKSEVEERTSISGVATGLAWTQTGGEILFIEASKMRGKGALQLTGQLGEIMQESAKAALSYLRVRCQQWGIPPNFYAKAELHVHVPNGAAPKDGPSAGIAIFVALVSLLTNRKVRHDVAMTGEITLRGLVLPVGGIKHKVLAAKESGIKTIILPEKNRKDLAEIPDVVKNVLKFKFIKKMDEAIKIALMPLTQ